MKKIGSIKMHDADLMSNDEMKRIVGGDLPTTTRTSCSVTCPDGGKATITNCDGDCVAIQSEHYVKCVGSGGQNVQKTYCPGFNTEIPVS